MKKCTSLAWQVQILFRVERLYTKIPRGKIEFSFREGLNVFYVNMA